MADPAFPPQGGPSDSTQRGESDTAPMKLTTKDIWDKNIAKTLQTIIDSAERMSFEPHQMTLPEFDKGLKYHPEGLLHTIHKQTMYYEFEVAGAKGLADYLYSYARDKEQMSDGNMFKYFSEDERKPKQILPFLITTMHPDIVRSLICGNISYRLRNDLAFENTFNRTSKPTTTPGIYFNQMFDHGTDMDADTQNIVPKQALPNNKGKGFSFDQWKVVHDRMGLYSATTNSDGTINTASTTFAKKVDNIHLARLYHDIIDHNLYPEERRFLKNKAARQNKLEEFLKQVEVVVLEGGKNLSQSEKAAQAQWSIFEIGYGTDTLDRLKSHIGNEDTNFIWGLLVAVVEVEWPGKFFIQQGQLLYLCHEDHRNLGEALCSVLASSYHDQMGCNPKRAGAIGRSPERAERGYRTNITMLFTDNGERHRAFKRGKEHNEECLARLEEWHRLEQAEPLNDKRDRVKANRDALLKRCANAIRREETIQYVMAEKKLIELLEEYLRTKKIPQQGQPDTTTGEN